MFSSPLVGRLAAHVWFIGGWAISGIFSAFLLGKLIIWFDGAAGEVEDGEQSQGKLSDTLAARTVHLRNVPPAKALHGRRRRQHCYG